MPARAEERKSEIIDGLASQLSTRLSGDEAGIAERFVRAYFRDVAPEELTERDPLDLYGAALAQLAARGTPAPGPALDRPAAPAASSRTGVGAHTRGAVP